MFTAISMLLAAFERNKAALPEPPFKWEKHEMRPFPTNWHYVRTTTGEVLATIVKARTYWVDLKQFNTLEAAKTYAEGIYGK